MGWSAERLSSLASTKSHKLFCVGADSVYDGMACFLDSSIHALTHQLWCETAVSRSVLAHGQSAFEL